MTFNQLVNYLQQHSGYQWLDGSSDETLQKSLAGEHRAPFVGDVLKAIIEKCQVSDIEQLVERGCVVSALGPVRLRVMQDDALVEEFKLLDKLVQAIDGAFDDEVLGRVPHSDHRWH